MTPDAQVCDAITTTPIRPIRHPCHSCTPDLLFPVAWARLSHTCACPINAHVETMNSEKLQRRWWQASLILILLAGPALSSDCACTYTSSSCGSANERVRVSGLEIDVSGTALKTFGAVDSPRLQFSGATWGNRSNRDFFRHLRRRRRSCPPFIPSAATDFVTVPRGGEASAAGSSQQEDDSGGSLRLSPWHSGIQMSSHSLKGNRPYMEDETFSSPGGEFSAVFDGHGGAAVSRYLRQNLWANLQAALPMAAAAEADAEREVVSGAEAAAAVATAGTGGGTPKPNLESGEMATVERANLDTPSSSSLSCPSRSGSLTVKACTQALEVAFAKVDSEICRISHWSYQGSTAVAVLFHEDAPPDNSVEGDKRNESERKSVVGGSSRRTIISANVGDSRAIVGRRGRAVQLTRDHKPSDPIERRRIEAVGGRVQWFGAVDDRGKPIGGTGVHRMNGNLAVARAIGDRSERPLVSAKVEIGRHPLQPETDFVLLASDGLWDVMTNDEGKCEQPNSS